MHPEAVLAADGNPAPAQRTTEFVYPTPSRPG
jgi:hypothetical protein